jgi:adenylyltransferase/sulfurtransferase
VPLTDEQWTRYDRNLRIPGFGEAGQERLATMRVAIVGLGGLGSPVGFYLAAVGVGTLGLFDSDVVELSNLQRQVLHNTPQLGRPKAESAAETLAALNPEVKFETSRVRITGENAAGILSGFDAVVEATDNFESKFVINDACLDLQKPFATAGILALSGQALFVVPGKTPCLRCAVPDVPRGVPTTSQQGVLGVVPGILGSVQAMEIIRYAVGLWQPASDGRGALHSVDGQTMRLRTMRIPRRPDCRCAPLWSLE